MISVDNRNGIKISCNAQLSYALDTVIGVIIHDQCLYRLVHMYVHRNEYTYIRRNEVSAIPPQDVRRCVGGTPASDGVFFSFPLSSKAVALLYSYATAIAMYATAMTLYT